MASVMFAAVAITELFFHPVSAQGWALLWHVVINQFVDQVFSFLIWPCRFRRLQIGHFARLAGR